jgi:hypothetical protein
MVRWYGSSKDDVLGYSFADGTPVTSTAFVEEIPWADPWVPKGFICKKWAGGSDEEKHHDDEEHGKHDDHDHGQHDENGEQNENGEQVQHEEHDEQEEHVEHQDAGDEKMSEDEKNQFT